jgi:hypothetical protein
MEKQPKKIEKLIEMEKQAKKIEKRIKKIERRLKKRESRAANEIDGVIGGVNGGAIASNEMDDVVGDVNGGGWMESKESCKGEILGKISGKVVSFVRHEEEDDLEKQQQAEYQAGLNASEAGNVIYTIW